MHERDSYLRRQEHVYESNFTDKTHELKPVF